MGEFYEPRIVPARVSPRHRRWLAACGDVRSYETGCPVLGEQPHFMALGGLHGVATRVNTAGRMSGVQEFTPRELQQLLLEEGDIVVVDHMDCAAITRVEDTANDMAYARPGGSVYKRGSLIRPDLVPDFRSVSEAVGAALREGKVSKPEEIRARFHEQLIARTRLVLGRNATCVVVNLQPETMQTPTSPEDDGHALAYGDDTHLFAKEGVIAEILKSHGYDPRALDATATMHVAALSRAVGGGLPLHVHRDNRNADG